MIEYIRVYGLLAIYWGILSLIIQACINVWLVYFGVKEISIWQSVSLITILSIIIWFINYFKKLK